MMRRFSALNDKMMRKLIANGVPEKIAAFVSDDANGFPHSSRKFLARAIMTSVAEYAVKRPDLNADALIDSYLEGGMPELMSIRDWLAMGDEADGSPINMHLHKTLKDMYRASEEWHDRLAEANGDKGHPSLYSRLADDVMIEFPDGWRIVNVPSYDLDNEGNLMGHCVGGDEYERIVKNGSAKIVSLRDPLNWPHATVEIRVQHISDPLDENGRENYRKNDRWVIRQIQGKANAPLLEKYKPYMRSFLEYRAPGVGEMTIDKDDENMLRPTSELLAEFRESGDKRYLRLINEQELIPLYLDMINKALSAGGDAYENLWMMYSEQELPKRATTFAGNHPEIPECRQFVLNGLNSPEWRSSMFIDIGRDKETNIFDFMSHGEAMPIIKQMLVEGQTWQRRVILQKLPPEVVDHPAFRSTLLELNGDSEIGERLYRMLQNAASMSAEEVAQILKHYHRNVIARTYPAFPNMNTWLMEFRRRDPEKFLAVMDMLPEEALDILGDNPIFMGRKWSPVGWDEMKDERPVMDQVKDLEGASQREDWILKNRLQRNRKEFKNRPEPPKQYSLMETVALLENHGMYHHADRLQALILEV
jgi:hypothetical protein